MGKGKGDDVQPKEERAYSLLVSEAPTNRKSKDSGRRPPRTSASGVSQVFRSLA